MTTDWIRPWQLLRWQTWKANNPCACGDSPATNQVQDIACAFAVLRQNPVRPPMAMDCIRPRQLLPWQTRKAHKPCAYGNSQAKIQVQDLAPRSNETNQNSFRGSRPTILSGVWFLLFLLHTFVYEVKVVRPSASPDVRRWPDSGGWDLYHMYSKRHDFMKH